MLAAAPWCWTATGDGVEVVVGVEVAEERRRTAAARGRSSGTASRYWPETGPQKMLCGRYCRLARGAAGSRALQPRAAAAKAFGALLRSRSRWGGCRRRTSTPGAPSTSSVQRRTRTLVRPCTARSSAAFIAVCGSPTRSGRTTSTQTTQRAVPSSSRIARADSSRTLADGSLVPELTSTTGGTAPTALSFFSGRRGRTTDLGLVGDVAVGQQVGEPRVDHEAERVAEDEGVLRRRPAAARRRRPSRRPGPRRRGSRRHRTGRLRTATMMARPGPPARRPHGTARRRRPSRPGATPAATAADGQQAAASTGPRSAAG